MNICGYMYQNIYTNKIPGVVRSDEATEDEVVNNAGGGCSNTLFEVV